MKNWKQNPMVGVVAVIITIAAIAFMVKTMMPKKYYYTADLKCEECGYVFQERLYGGQPFPVKCPECGANAAYSAVKCMDCGEIFIVKPVELFPKLEEGREPTPEEMARMEEAMMGMPKCPKCSSVNIGSVRKIEGAKAE